MKCSSVVRVKRGFACAEDNTQACEFHISACSKKTSTWIFGKVSKIHTCRVNQLGRERNVNAKFLMAASDAICKFVPGDRKSYGSTKQLQKI